MQLFNRSGILKKNGIFEVIFIEWRHDEDRVFPFDPNHVELTWNRLQFPLLCTPAIHWWKKGVSMSGFRPLPPALLLCAFSRLLWRSPDLNNTWQIECQKTCHTKMSDKNATMYVREKVGQNAREDVLDYSRCLIVCQIECHKTANR